MNQEPRSPIDDSGDDSDGKDLADGKEDDVEEDDLDEPRKSRGGVKTRRKDQKSDEKEEKDGKHRTRDKRHKKGKSKESAKTRTKSEREREHGEMRARYKLLYAARGNDIKMLQQYIIEEHEDVNQTTKNGSTPLMIAARNGHLEAVKILLDHNADPNKTKPEGSSALVQAARNGHFDIVRCLVDEYGVTVKDQGLRALLSAAHHGWTDIVRFLVQCGVNSNARRHDTATPLYLACRHGHIKTVECLVKECKADFNLGHGVDSETAMMIATRKGHTEVVKFLLKNHASPSQVKTDGTTALMMAAKRDLTDIGKLLISEKADVDQKKNDGYTAIMFAALHGSLDMIKFLIGVISETKHEITPEVLTLSSRNGHLHVVKHLIAEAHLDPNGVDHRGWTALLRASQKNHLELVTYLLQDAKADVNTVAKEWTPIAVSSRYGNLNITKYLIETKADLNLGEKNLPLSVLFKRLDTSIKSGANDVESHFSAVRYLVYAGADVGKCPDAVLEPTIPAPQHARLKEVIQLGIRDRYLPHVVNHLKICLDGAVADVLIDIIGDYAIPTIDEEIERCIKKTTDRQPSGQQKGKKCIIM